MSRNPDDGRRMAASAAPADEAVSALSPTLAENPLSEREMDVARLLVTGASNNDIARELVISPHTVKVHLRNIYEKLGVGSRAEATALLLQRGWVTLPGVEVPQVEETVPEPPPLEDDPGSLFPWQLPYLVGAVLLCVAALLFPVFAGQGRSQATLLSDGAAPAVGPATLLTLPRWQARAPLPLPRSRLGAAVLMDDQVYAVGGEGVQGTLLDRVERYDPGVNEWEPVAALPVPLSNLSVATDGRLIYVAGGTTASAEGLLQVSDVLWRYSPVTDAWQQLGWLPRPLAGAALVYWDGALYLVGGWDGETMRDEVWWVPLPEDSSIAAEDWRPLGRLRAPRAFLGAVAVDGLLYVAGGYDGAQERAEAEVIRIADGQHEMLPPLSTPRGGMALLWDGLSIFAVGGGWTRPTSSMERFDRATGMWSNVPAPYPGEWRNMGAAATPDGYLHLVGGWSGGYLNAYLRYQSSFRTFLPSTKNAGE